MKTIDPFTNTINLQENNQFFFDLTSPNNNFKRKWNTEEEKSNYKRYLSQDFFDINKNTAARINVEIPRPSQSREKKRSIISEDQAFENMHTPKRYLRFDPRENAQNERKELLQNEKNKDFQVINEDGEQLTLIKMPANNHLENSNNQKRNALMNHEYINRNSISRIYNNFKVPKTLPISFNNADPQKMSIVLYKPEMNQYPQFNSRFVDVTEEDMDDEL